MPTSHVKLGLIGENISRSLAPRLHVHLGHIHGLSVQYDLLDAAGIEAYHPVEVARRCARDGYTGVNVTHPFKRAFGDQVCIDDTLVARLESVNCVRFNVPGWSATNTDYSGFLRAYRHRFVNTRPGRVVMIGAGGVGRSIAHGLMELGAESLAICDANESACHALTDDIVRRGGEARKVSAADLPEAIVNASGLVNCTPLGMYHHPGNPFPASKLPRSGWAFDAIYTPTMTPFLQAAQAAGLEIMSGFELFLFQGLDAFRFFSGLETPQEAMRPIAEQWVRGQG